MGRRSSSTNREIYNFVKWFLAAVRLKDRTQIRAIPMHDTFVVVARGFEDYNFMYRPFVEKYANLSYGISKCLEFGLCSWDLGDWSDPRLILNFSRAAAEDLLQEAEEHGMREEIEEAVDEWYRKYMNEAW